MEKKRMANWLKTLLLVMLLALCNSVSAAPYANKQHGTPAEKQRDCIIEHRDSQQAILSNTNELARICSSRPERIITSTSNFLHTMRTPAKPTHLFNLQKISFCHYRGTGKTESRPIMPAPSSAYYVLTLRHLLC